MPYAQVSDVRGLAPHVPINAQSQPSEGEVSQWLKDVEKNLNAVLSSLGYETPIVGPESLAVLKLPLANAVMALVMRARPNPESDPEAFQRQYDRFVTALKDPRDEFELPADAVRIDVMIKQGNFRSAREFIDMARDDDIGVRSNMKF